MPVAPGDPSPPIDLLDQTGQSIPDSDLRQGRVLVFFYPKANTPGCTQQACALRDIANQIGDTRIVGVSPDKPSAQLKFAAAHSLAYTLLCDTEHAVADSFGVWQEKINYGKRYMGIVRSAFLLNHGVIERAWYKISPKDTPTKLLEALSA